MEYYRIYFLEPIAKHFTAMIDFEASSDALAITRAEATPSWMDRELWNLGRKVLVLKRQASVQTIN
jgi:hypothetical protein